ASATAATTSTTTAETTGRTWRRIAAQVPLNPVQTNITRRRQISNYFTGVVHDREFHITGRSRLQVVTNCRSWSGIRSTEELRATPETTQTRIVLPDRAGSHFKQSR